MSALQPCLACRRHVRVSETTCPFCQTAMPEAAPRPMPTQRLGRAATFAFGAAVTMSAAGCGQASTPGNDAGNHAGNDAGTDAYVGALDAAYGGPPVDAATVDAAAEVDSGLVAAYGGPPLDSALPDSGTLALYGAPPPPPTPPER